MARAVIAVVERDLAFLEMLHEVLTDQGYQTILWSRSQDAFELIVRERPDLVILDVWLEHPHAGEMVLGLLQADPATREIPVIVCTTDVRFHEQRAETLRDKPYSILIKPFDLSDLLATIEEMIIAARRTRPPRAPGTGDADT